jgi:hypothetical protein
VSYISRSKRVYRQKQGAATEGRDKGQRQKAETRRRKDRLLYFINVFNYRLLNLYLLVVLN